MTQVITFANQKGGVGKTTLAVNVGAGLAKSNRSRRVLIVDLDPQGQVAEFLGKSTGPGAFNVLVEVSNINDEVEKIATGLYILPGNKRTSAAMTLLTAEGKKVGYLADILKYSRDKDGVKFDYIIIDTSPSVGILQEMAVYAADYVIIPCEATAASVHGLAMFTRSLENMKEHGWKGRIGGIVPMKVDLRNKEDAVQLVQLQKHFGNIATMPIYRNVRFAESTAHGQNIFDYTSQRSDNSSRRAADDMARIVWLVRDLP